MEYLDLYDKNGNKTGKTMIRGQEVPEGCFFNIVTCFIRNKEGKYLMQKTSKQKGSLYATTGGHVSAGQTFIEAMIRELKEEIGVNVEENELIFIDKYIKNNQAVFNIYYLEKEIDIDRCKLQEEEVEAVYWMTEEEIQEKIKKGQCHSTHKLLYETLKKCLHNRENVV